MNRHTAFVLNCAPAPLLFFSKDCAGWEVSGSQQRIEKLLFSACWQSIHHASKPKTQLAQTEFSWS